MHTVSYICLRSCWQCNLCVNPFERHQFYSRAFSVYWSILLHRGLSWQCIFLEKQGHCYSRREQNKCSYYRVGLSKLSSVGLSSRLGFSLIVTSFWRLHWNLGLTVLMTSWYQQQIVWWTGFTKGWTPPNSIDVDFEQLPRISQLFTTP